MKATLTQYHFGRIGVENITTSRNALEYLRVEYALGKGDKSGWRLVGDPRQAKLFDSQDNLVAEMVMVKDSRGRYRSKSATMGRTTDRAARRRGVR